MALNDLVTMLIGVLESILGWLQWLVPWVSLLQS